MREEVVGQPTCHVPHPGDGWLGADSTYCGAAVLKAQSRRPKTSGSGSGVRLGCTVCEWCYTRKNEDTGHESANISRDIPQCWPMSLETGVLTKKARSTAPLPRQVLEPSSSANPPSVSAPGL